MSDWCNSTSVISPSGLSDYNSVVCTLTRRLAKNVSNKVKIKCNIHVNKAAFGKWLAEYNGPLTLLDEILKKFETGKILPHHERAS